MTLEIRLLGPVEVRLDGREVVLGSRMQRTLLALLALADGAPLPEHRLADALWPGAAPASATSPTTRR